MSVPISPCKILVLGHSYVYWVGAFVRSAGPTSAGLFDDFAVAGRPCQLAYEGFTERWLPLYYRPQSCPGLLRVAWTL